MQQLVPRLKQTQWVVWDSCQCCVSWFACHVNPLIRDIWSSLESGVLQDIIEALHHALGTLCKQSQQLT